ncbi:MAG: CHAT domain-containing protein [Rhodothermaceae bacterium]|nr:CHAT domain-containing protein [Rhodothermaceae bacterium]
MIGLVLMSLMKTGDAAAQSACEQPFGDVGTAYYARYETGRTDWEALGPLIARARRCFGEARTAAHAQLYDYEVSVLSLQRRFAEADSVIGVFFADFASVAAPDVVARMHLRRAYLYSRRGRTADRLHEYAQAAAMMAELPPREAAQALSRMGTAYRTVGDFYTAQRYLTQADSIFSALYVEDPVQYGPLLGRVRLRRAEILIHEGERGDRTPADLLRRARPLLADALRLIPPTPAEAYIRQQALLWMVLMLRLSEEPQVALAYAEEAHRLNRLVSASYPVGETWAWRSEGDIHLDLGNHALAAAAYERARTLAQASNELGEERQAEVGLGQVAEARAVDLAGYRQAEAHFRRAAALAERRRASFGTHDWSASAWESAQKPYRHLTRVLLKQGRPAEAFAALDATRARYLRDLRRLASLQNRLDLADRVRLDSLNEHLYEVRYALGARDLPIARRSELNGELLALQRQIEALMEFAETDPDSLDVSALQRSLADNNQVLLSYFFDEESAFVFVVRSDTLLAVKLATSEAALREDLAQVSSLWSLDDPEAVASAPSFNLRPLERIYDALVAPIRAEIPSEAALVIVPQGVLSRFPFGLLLEAEHPPYEYATAPYLFRSHRITTELAAGLLLETTSVSERALPMLALGRSRFGGLRPGPFRDRDAPRLPDLPAVEDEVRQIHRRLGGLEALNETATEDFLYAHLGEARLLHLASHAFVDPILPLYSRVVLWGSSEGNDDGTLYLYELQGRAVAPELVVLSGCSTARGRTRVGEGMMGMQYAFRAMGTRSVLATLWQIEDAATVDLMDRFYVHLRRGLAKDEALRQAQFDYLDSHEGREASPFFWAAPVLYGNTDAVSLEMPAPSARLWIPVGLLLVVIGLALSRFLRRAAHG